MKASKFKRFKRNLGSQLDLFFVKAHTPGERKEASDILAWIINQTRVTLRNHQLVEAWKSLVGDSWSLEDFDLFGANNDLILHKIKLKIKNHTSKFN